MTHFLEVHDAALTQSPSRIGILDWGIGGLGFYKAFREKFPQIDILYLSDSGFTPYGKAPRKILIQRIQEIVSFFKAQKISFLALACNAASTTLPFLEKKSLSNSIQVNGIIQAGIQIALHSKARTIGVLGGARTIRSQIYRKALEKEGKKVFQRIAQPLSALIEKGEINSLTMRRTLKRIVLPLRDCDALLLACTHYPSVRFLFEEHFPNIEILDPISKWMEQIQHNWSLSDSKIGNSFFFTTGDTLQMQVSARRAFGVGVKKVQKLDLDLKTLVSRF